MLRQYHAPRHRIRTVGHGRSTRTLPVGTIEVGAILYLQDSHPGLLAPTMRDPERVVGWHNRIVAGARVTTAAGGTRRHSDVVMTGGHLAIVQSLRTGRTRCVADHYLRHADDAGLWLHDARPRGSFQAFAEAERRRRDR